jgi:hypothetical protein
MLAHTLKYGALYMSWQAVDRLLMYKLAGKRPSTSLILYMVAEVEQKPIDLVQIDRFVSRHAIL